MSKLPPQKLYPYSYLEDVYLNHIIIKEVPTQDELEIPKIDIILRLKHGTLVKYRMSKRMYKDTETRYDLQKHVIDKLNLLVVQELLNDNSDTTTNGD